jgi:hypothetical protein
MGNFKIFNLLGILSVLQRIQRLFREDYVTKQPIFSSRPVSSEHGDWGIDLKGRLNPKNDFCKPVFAHNPPFYRSFLGKRLQVPGIGPWYGIFGFVVHSQSGREITVET